MNWSNVTAGFTTSVIAHFILPNFNSYTQAAWVFSSRFIQYKSTAFTIILKYYHTPSDSALHCLLTHTAFFSLFYFSLFFLKKGDTLFQLTLWLEKRIRKTKCCPFSKCPMEKNKKALQYHSMFVHWGGSVDLWWSETLNASTPVCMTQCKHVQDQTPVREMSIVDYLRFNHMKAFLMRVDRETWQSYISLRP